MDNRFYTGKPCKYGHSGKRYVASRSCVECEAIRIRSSFRKQYKKRWNQTEEGKASYVRWKTSDAGKIYIGSETEARSKAKYRQENQEVCNARTSEWRKKYPGKNRAMVARRHATKLRATPPWLTPDQLAEMEVIYRDAHAKGLHVDHIVPLRGRNVRGLHVPWNLQPLPRKENLAKGNRLIV